MGAMALGPSSPGCTSLRKLTIVPLPDLTRYSEAMMMIADSCPRTSGSTDLSRITQSCFRHDALSKCSRGKRGSKKTSSEEERVKDGCFCARWSRMMSPRVVYISEVESPRVLLLIGCVSGWTQGRVDRSDATGP